METLAEAKANYLATRTAEESVRRAGFARYMAALDKESTRLDREILSYR